MQLNNLNTVYGENTNRTVVFIHLWKTLEIYQSIEFPDIPFFLLSEKDVPSSLIAARKELKLFATTGPENENVVLLFY